MILYFSGTGNSRFCAEYLAQYLHDDATDLFQYLRNGIGGDFVSGSPWVIVSPTYAWQLPRILQDFLRTASFAGSGQVYFVMTCGSDIGDAAACNEALCRELRLRYMGTAEIVMPENYIAMFDTPDEKTARFIRTTAMSSLLAAAARMANCDPLPPRESRPGDRLKSGAINKAFYPLFVKARAFRASDRCTSCGACVRSCVTGNIRLEGGKPVWGDRCTHCMACICGCPAEAIEYGKKSVGKPRYQCPPYEE